MYLASTVSTGMNVQQQGFIVPSGLFLNAGIPVTKVLWQMIRENDSKILSQEVLCSPFRTKFQPISETATVSVFFLTTV